MTKFPSAARRGIALLASVLLTALLAGCVGNMPHRGAWVAEAKPARLQPETSATMAADQYLYYPAYAIYYNRTQDNYVSLESDEWVTRAAPPRVAVAELRAAAFVLMEFHDGPARHHANVALKYPKNWPAPKFTLVAGSAAHPVIVTP